MFQRRFLLSLVASFLSLYLHITVVLGATHHVVQMKSLESALTCLPSAKGPARGLRIGHRYGPCSPLTPKNSARHLSQILIRDQSRVRSINSLTSNKNPTNDQGKLAVVNRHIGGGNFVVTVGFGTPERHFALIFDTGSNVTWVKCKPCAGKNCDTHDENIYKPSISSTFLNGTTTNPSLSFSMHYHDGSSSSGYYVRDTLTLTPSDVFPNFVFGCSEHNSGYFGHAAGVLAVGQNGPHSLIPQTGQKFGKKFCYCLPANVHSTGYLLFGEEAIETCQTNNFTPLSMEPDGPDYIVHLNGITIGNQRLNFSSTSKTILDSGTVITRLPPSVYSKLQSAFQASMSQYPRAPKLPSLLDTCYHLKKYENAKIPRMVMHYESMDVNLDQLSVIWKENSTVCLAFAANDDESLTIIGNHQQLNLNVFYNIPEGKVSIGTGGCGK